MDLPCASTHGTAELAVLLVPVQRTRLVVEALAFGLRAHGLAARVASDRDGLPGRNPAVVAVDASAPAADVAEMCARMRDLVPGVPVVLLMEKPTPEPAAIAAATGADGCVYRNEPLHDVAAALAAAARGESKRIIDLHPGHQNAPSELPRLTQREREVLALIAGGASSDAVALRLDISPHTVRTHVQNVLVKLGVTNRLAAAVVARRWGLLAASPDAHQVVGRAAP